MEKKPDQKKKILINFDKNLYSFKAIKLAIKKYRNLADFDLEQKNNYIQVKLKNIDKDLKDIIKDEFCNYVLFLMKS